MAQERREEDDCCYDRELLGFKTVSRRDYFNVAAPDSRHAYSELDI